MLHQSNLTCLQALGKYRLCDNMVEVIRAYKTFGEYNFPMER
jgi:hypothetical protein